MGRKRKAAILKAELMKKRRSGAVKTDDTNLNVSAVCRLEDLKASSPIKKSISEDTDTNLIISTNALKALFSNCICQHCFQQTLQIQLGKPQGLCRKVTIYCVNCGFSFSEQSSSKISDSDDSPKINRRFVHAVSEVGMGHAALEKFSAILNMPCMDSRTFTRHLKLVHMNAVICVNEELDIIRSKVRQRHKETLNENNNLCDIAVSYDATWHKRGHNSNFSVGCVIDASSGYIIDYEVLSKICYDCIDAEKSLGKDTAEFQIWHTGHISSCDKNYTGSSGGMEAEMAKRMWSRSQDLGFRYVEIISDGDSSTFPELQKLKVYGSNVTLTKTECINHVGKRMGTALRKLVDNEKKRGITLGGKKYGSLTLPVIKRITRYYRNSIIRNKGNVANMKKDIYAILKHCSSTDKNLKHTSCPTGSKSWCFYNRAIALKKKPVSHKSGLHTPLREEVIAKIMPIFQRLASDNLLQKCSQGETQNRNESLHSMIWGRCPKVKNCSKVRVDFAALRGISDFNQGVKKSLINNMKSAKSDFFSVKILNQIQDRHRRKSAAKSTEAFKIYRKKLELAKINLNSVLNKKTTYSPGSF